MKPICEIKSLKPTARVDGFEIAEGGRDWKFNEPGITFNEIGLTFNGIQMYKNIRPVGRIRGLSPVGYIR